MKYKNSAWSVITAIMLIPTAHAGELGKININDPVMGQKTIVYRNMDNFAVTEGDIIITKLSASNPNHLAVVIPKVGGTRWEHGIIPYEISDEMPFSNKLAILQAIDHWQKNTNIEFVELTSKNRSLYKDYILFIPASGTTCSSYVGKHGEKQEINLSPRCTTMNTVHEIGHALGLWHEQSRSDRDSYIRIVWENISEEHKYNFDQHLTDGKDYGAYDYQSIMHYSQFAFSKNGEKTIIPLQSDIEIGQRNHLSEKDIAAIKAMYPEA